MKSASPQISIVLPFFNAERTLHRALESVSHQSWENFECILVNNNSRDESSKIASYFCEKDPRFTLLNEAKQGVVFASNKGTDAAMGKYICRMDSDDELTSDSLAIRMNFLDKYPDYDVVCGLAEYIPHRNNTKGFRRYVKWSNSIQSYDEILINRFSETPVINPTAMWRKHIGIQHGMYRYGDFPEDYELWLRWLDAGVRIHKLNELVIKWYDSDDRLTRSSPFYREKAFFKIKARYIARWLKDYKRPDTEIWVWGASRRSRRWSGFLKEEGIIISAYIDIHNKRHKEDLNIVYYKEIPSSEDIFILVYNRHHAQKKEIAEFLLKRGFIEGRDFLFAG